VSTKLEGNRRIALRYFDLMGSGNRQSLEAAMNATMAQDVVWHVPTSAPNGGTTAGRAAVLELLTGTTGIDIYRRDSMRIDIERTLAENEYVMVQFKFSAITKAGVDYENEFIFLFRIVDGMIKEFWETFDTHHLYRVHPIKPPGSVAG